MTGWAYFAAILEMEVSLISSCFSLVRWRFGLLQGHSSEQFLTLGSEGREDFYRFYSRREDLHLTVANFVYPKARRKKRKLVITMIIQNARRVFIF
jgi:hypothetical protein